MPDLARVRAAFDNLRDAVLAALESRPETPPPPGPTPTPTPTPTPVPSGPPAKPTGLACTIGPDARPVLTWDDAADAAKWKVRDRNNSADPVKEVVTSPRSVRSPVKAGSPPRLYDIIAVGPTGLESEPSDPVDVPPTADDTPVGKGLPTDVLPILKTWTVTTTTGKPGSPTNKYPVGDHASIAGVFYVRDDGGVMFHATVNGFTTPNSKRCRVEGRQMADDKWTKAAWNGNDPHTLDAELWVSTAGLQKRKRVSALQIHDGGDDVLQVLADAEHGLIVLTDDGQTMTVLDPDYRDEQRFTCRIETGGGKVKVTYNGAKTVEFAKAGTSWYFKAGAYNQSSMSEHGEPPTAYGEVCIYRLEATGKLVG